VYSELALFSKPTSFGTVTFGKIGINIDQFAFCFPLKMAYSTTSGLILLRSKRFATKTRSHDGIQIIHRGFDS